MNLIAQGLGKISERWAEFHSFFDFTLDGSDSLMEPSEHDNLLFDDGAFSRSRRYFWAIDCLSEFEISISDNINQWELFKQARVLPLLAADALPELEYRQFKQAEKQCRILHVQRENFRQKLASTKALRDAVSHSHICEVFDTSDSAFPGGIDEITTRSWTVASTRVMETPVGKWTTDAAARGITLSITSC